MRKTLVVNLIGGPGSGKSTLASGIFSALKLKGVNCEYATEFAKDCVWENRTETLKDELYIFSKQYHRVFRLKGNVDVIITDRPLFMTLWYNQRTQVPYLNELCLSAFNENPNINIFVKRKGEFNQSGRNETLDEAIDIDHGYRDIMGQYDIPIHIETEKSDLMGINALAEKVYDIYRNYLETGEVSNNE